MVSKDLLCFSRKKKKSFITKKLFEFLFQKTHTPSPTACIVVLNLFTGRSFQIFSTRIPGRDILRACVVV
jgi:hypothetical protein